MVTALLLAGGCGSAGDPTARPSASGVPTATPTPVAPEVVLHTVTRALPNVPSDGIVVNQAGVATFRSLDGRTGVPMPGFRLTMVTGSRSWLTAKDGSTWLFDTAARQLVQHEQQYDAFDGIELLPGLPRAEKRGHWRYVLPGPDGQLLGQWSGECEVPSVYVLDRQRRRRLVSPAGEHVNAHARGWTRAGQAVIEFPESPCGTGLPAPGLYLETRPGKYRLLARTDVGGYYQLPSMADATRVPLCGPAAYQLKAVAEGATGDIAAGAELHPLTSTPCRVDVLISLGLQDPVTDGQLHIPSASVRVRVRGLLTRTAGLHADAVWAQPYCPTGDVDLLVGDGRGNTDIIRGVLHPRCDPAAGQSGRGPGLQAATQNADYDR